MLGTTEIIIIVMAIIFMFGGKKSLEWVKSFKAAKDEITKEFKK
jgi:hypothetical protein